MRCHCIWWIALKNILISATWKSSPKYPMKLCVCCNRFFVWTTTVGKYSYLYCVWFCFLCLYFSNTGKHASLWDDNSEIVRGFSFSKFNTSNLGLGIYVFYFFFFMWKEDLSSDIRVELLSNIKQKVLLKQSIFFVLVLESKKILQVYVISLIMRSLMWKKL